MTGRGQANALTRTTAILATLFFATSLALSVIASYGRAPSSILDRAAPAGQPAPAQGGGQGGSILDQLQQMQGGQPAAPAAPAAPATPSIPFQAPGAPAAPAPQ
jgi:preprotein translocase subunit SecG